MHKQLIAECRQKMYDLNRSIMESTVDDVIITKLQKVSELLEQVQEYVEYQNYDPDEDIAFNSDSAQIRLAEMINDDDDVCPECLEAPCVCHDAINESKQVTKLGDLVKITTAQENSDFFIVRRGSEEKVGSPTKKYNPEHYGVTVEATDVIDPNYLFYLIQYIHSTGYFKRLARGTLRLSNIRKEDITNIKLETNSPVNETTSAGSVATVVGGGKNAGTLFGGSYQQRRTKKAKKSK